MNDGIITIQELQQAITAGAATYNKSKGDNKMKMYTVNERTTEIKCRLERGEEKELDCTILEKKVNAEIERTMNGCSDDYFEYTNINKALKKYEDLKKSGMTYYSASCNLLYIYQVYIEEDEVDENGRIDYGETIKFYTDSDVKWRA